MARGMVSSRTISTTSPGVGTLLRGDGVKVYNLSPVVLPQGVISLASLGPKFVPYTQSDPDTTRIDILNFCRTLLLIAQFHDSTFEDEG